MSLRHPVSLPTAARCVSCRVLLALAFAVLVASPAAASIWDEALTADPQALLAAASEVEAGGAAVNVLLDHREVRFEEDGRRSDLYLLVYRPNTSMAAQDWAMATGVWSPWHQQPPEIRARVITAGGRELWLDAATLSEQPVASDDPAVFTDQRSLVAPLPGIGAGAVVAEELVLRDSAPFFAAGVAERQTFGRGVPIERQRFVLDAPLALQLHFEAALVGVEPRREESDGRVRWTWDLGRQEAVERQVFDAPGEVPVHAVVTYATGRSWEEIGAAYAAWIDERLAGAALPEEVTAAMAAAEGRQAKIAAALAWLHREVRYTGLSLGESGIVPYSPAEVLARQYGDCKDKATLLVAALRQAGIEANVALLASGPGIDVDPDLPGLGLFDHAIVHVPGEPELWIDATVAEARLGQIPANDRGRLALVTRSAGAALRRVPAAASGENAYRIEREVTLSDWGSGREVSSEAISGEFEIWFRANLPTLVAGDEAFAAAELEEPPADDPTQPLVVRFPVETADVGATDLDWAVYLVDTHFLTDHLPLALLAGEEGVPRDFDLHVDAPYVAEFRLRVVPPTGFTADEFPPSERRAVGVASFERQVEEAADGAVSVRLRFEFGPSRLTPSEIALTRDAVAELRSDQALELRFRSRGQALLEAGQVREAVDELRRVADAEPRPSHRSRLAHALLSAGLGEAARREARAAVALDPESVVGHQTLGFVLVHDLFGRQFLPGHDGVEAEAAFNRALELDPGDATSRLNLAILLEYGEDGRRYGRGGRLDEAVEQYRLLRGEHGVTDHDHNLLVALWQARRFEEVASLAAEQTVTGAKSFALAAAAARDGAAAALREAAKIADLDQRRSLLTAAADLLIQARLYPAASELTAATAQGAPDAAARLARASAQRKIVSHESLHFAATDPRAALLRVLRAFLLPDRGEQQALIADAETVGGLPDELVEELREGYAAVRRQFSVLGMSPEVIVDAVQAAMEVQQTGSAQAGYRLRAQAPAGQQETWYLAIDQRGRAVPVAHGGSDAPAFGLQVLRHLDAGRFEAARLWLDWAREEAWTGSADDPWSGAPLAALWRRGETGDETAIRRAASGLLAGGEQARDVVANLEEWLAASGDEAQRRGLEKALIDAYAQLERWPDVARLAGRWLAAAPDSDAAFVRLISALTGAQDLDGIAAAADERLVRRPDDAQALRSLHHVAGARGDFAASRALLGRLVDSPGRRPEDLNSLAWLALFDGRLDEQALELAHRAVQGVGGRGYDSLHTLASLLAELDRPLEAKDVILQAFELSPDEGPRNSDWFVLGRIAESYGEIDAARAAYARVERPESDLDIPLATWTLAQRRLAALEARATARPTAGAAR